MSDIVSVLENIEESVNRVERAVNENSAASLARFALWVVVFIAVVSLGSKAWYSRWRYAWQYSVESSKVQIADQPHDCKFLATPLGEKYCHYEVKVATVRWAKSTDGQPITSFDGGKTWDKFTPDPEARVPNSPTVQEVYISWEKRTD